MDRGGPTPELPGLEGQQCIKVPPTPFQPGQKVLWSYTASPEAECGNQ